MARAACGRRDHRAALARARRAAIVPDARARPARRGAAVRRPARAARGPGSDADRHSDRPAARRRGRPLSGLGRPAADHRRAAHAAAVHGRRVARAAHPVSVVARRRTWRSAASIATRANIARRSRSSAARRGGWAGSSTTCWCSRAPTPAAIRCGRSICISTRSSPSAGAPSDVLAAERGVTIRLAGATGDLRTGDEDLLRRLVLNVLQNAVQHTPAGGASRWNSSGEPGRRASARQRPRARHSGGGSGADLRSVRAARCVARRAGNGLGLPIARGSPRRTAARSCSRRAARRQHVYGGLAGEPARESAAGRRWALAGFLLRGALARRLCGAGSLVACSATRRVANVLRPCSSKSITVWCSLTSTSVPGP